uniref:Uncharacterized protein n=1 Tax=Cacopsylla melanoneura TaxID=428564 RepID=A0A8D9EWQ7_9HEMI
MRCMVCINYVDTFLIGRKCRSQDFDKFLLNRKKTVSYTKVVRKTEKRHRNFVIFKGFSATECNAEVSGGRKLGIDILLYLFKNYKIKKIIYLISCKVKCIIFTRLVYVCLEFLNTVVFARVAILEPCRENH